MWLAHSSWGKFWTVGLPWRIFQTRGSHLQLKNCIMLGINLAIPFLEGLRKDASLRLLKFSGFDLNARQAIARGDDMCYMDVIPSIRLYRFEVGNILGEVQDTINRRYGIYLHHSDLTMEQADGNPVNRGYNFLDVVFSSLSSNWGQNFTRGYKICNLVVNYEQNIEALMLSEEVHLAIWEQWFAELVWSLEKRWKRELHFQPWFICFSFEKDRMRIHVSFRFASSRIAWWNLHSSLVQICPCFWDVVFFSKVMEGLDFITLYVALSQGQVDSILGGGVAMPQESSQRFGLRVSKEEAVQRSHDFAEWERLYVTRGGEVLTHKDFIICTIRVYAIGYLQKSIGEVLVRTKPTEYRWRGGIQHREVMSDGRVFYEITNYERIL